MTVNQRRNLFRVILVVALVAFGFVLFYIGKEHDVLADNETTTIDGKEYKALAYATLHVDGEEKPADLWADDRVIVKMPGPKHHLKLSVYEEDEETLIKTVERDIDLGATSVVMISLPAMAGEAANFFLPPPVQETEMSSGGGDESETTGTEGESGSTN